MKVAGWLGLATFCVVGAGAYVAFVLNTPYAGFRQPVFVDLPRGTSTLQMATLLRHSGVIRHFWAFLAARAVRPGARLEAGEYQFSRPASALQVFDRIARGDVFYYELVVPEGKNMFDIADEAQRLGLFPSAKFLKAAHDTALIRDLDPRAPTLEGYLFPDTYRLSRHTTPEDLCRIMTRRFRQEWTKLETRAPVHRTVTLASMVEKEGRIAEERPLIASVFLSRLALGMKLDCDPTTIYAALLAGSYSGAIHRSDLSSDSPYNTYQHAGLPPGPIANPGLAAIKAVLDPAGAHYLYFVARGDGSGSHVFSSSLAVHRANVLRYRRAIDHQRRKASSKNMQM